MYNKIKDLIYQIDQAKLLMNQCLLTIEEELAKTTNITQKLVHDIVNTSRTKNSIQDKHIVNTRYHVARAEYDTSKQFILEWKKDILELFKTVKLHNIKVYKTMLFRLKGYKQKEIAKIMNKSTRMIRYYYKEMERK